jgi:hypothetical protein
MHHVADIDQAESNTPADRCGDATISQLQLGIIDLPLIRSHHAFVLTYQRLLRVELLLGNGVLRKQHLIAFQIDFGVDQQSLIAGHLSFGLSKLDLKRPRIDFGQQLTGRDSLAFLKQHIDQLTVDSTLHGYRVVRHDRAKTIQVDIHVPGLCCCGYYGHIRGTTPRAPVV